MRIRQLSALTLTVATLGLAACNDDNTPRTTVITNPTQPGVPTPAPTPTPTVVTAGSFATDQTKSATCSNNSSADVNAVSFTDSEAAVDVESLTPGCAGGPAS